MDDTDWCLFCNRHFQPNENNVAYCTPECKNRDNSRSAPIRVLSPQSFDLPGIPLPYPASAKDCQPFRWKKVYRSELLSSPAYFHDEELQDLKAATQLATQHTDIDREAILLWARAVSPGLEEVPPSPTLGISMSVPTGLDRQLERSPHFPLTAQNPAPPCITVLPRHTSPPTIFHSRCEDYTPSLSQDDGSILTPATSSLIAPSIPDESIPPSSTKPLLRRVVNKVRSWMASPSHVREGKPNPSDAMVHSDETIRVHHLSTYRTAFDLPRSHICQSDADFARDCCGSDIM